MRHRSRHLGPGRITAILALAPLLLLGCAGAGDAEGDETPAAEPADETPETPVGIATEPPLGSWLLESFADGGEVEEGAITLQILPEERVAGTGGCNRYMGPYEADGSGGLSFGLLGSTMMACPEEVMEREHRYLATLEKVSGFRLEGDKLVLLIVEGDDLLVYRRAEEPEGGAAAGKETVP
jgi:heat shock protein HslJ